MLALKDRETDPGGTEYLLSEIDRMAHLLRLLCLGTGKRVAPLCEYRFCHPATERAQSEASGISLISREEIRNIAFHLKDLHKRNQKICKLILFRLNERFPRRGRLGCRSGALHDRACSAAAAAATSEWCKLVPDRRRPRPMREI